VCLSNKTAEERGDIEMEDGEEVVACWMEIKLPLCLTLAEKPFIHYLVGLT
jgi:hypothetical protein